MGDKIILAYYVGTRDMDVVEERKAVSEARLTINEMCRDNKNLQIIILTNSEEADSFIDVLYPRFVVMDKHESSKMISKIDDISDKILSSLDYLDGEDYEED